MRCDQPTLPLPCNDFCFGILWISSFSRWNYISYHLESCSWVTCQLVCLVLLSPMIQWMSIAEIIIKFDGRWWFVVYTSQNTIRKVLKGTKYGTLCIWRISRARTLNFGIRVTDGEYDRRINGFFEIAL